MANKWSASNSTGTTEMGIWGSSSAPVAEKNSDFGDFTNDALPDTETLPTHRYPLYIDNLNGANETPIVQECIHFTAVKQGGISLQADADNSKAIAEAEANEHRADNTGKRGPTVMDGIGNGSNNSIKKIAEQKGAGSAQEDAKNEERSLTEIAKEKTNMIKDAVVGFVKHHAEALRSPPKNLEHCFLYMPGSVTFSEGASWGAAELGGMGRAIRDAVRGEGQISDMLKNFGGSAATTVAQAAGIAAAGKAAGALGVIGAGMIGGNIGAGLKAAGRFVKNPYEEQLFNGIGFREFSFEFVFAPQSEAEGEEIDKIINMFRFHSRPNFIKGMLGEGQYTFPNEFSIEFLMNGPGGVFHPNRYIPSIYNCVCTNVATNYTPEGFWVALRDGRPVSYGLSLSFTETRKITQDDITSGY